MLLILEMCLKGKEVVPPWRRGEEDVQGTLPCPLGDFGRPRDRKYAESGIRLNAPLSSLVDGETDGRKGLGGSLGKG